MPEQDNINELKKIELFSSDKEKLSAPAFIAKAKLLESQGLYDQAIREVKNAVLEEPMNSYYHSLMADYAYRTNNISLAYREALTAYQLGAKSFEQSLILAKMAVALTEYSIVNDIIDSLALVYPNNNEVLFIAARKYDNDGNNSRAYEYYNKVLNSDLSNGEAIYYYARLLTKNNEFQKAKEIISLDSISSSANHLRLLQKIYTGLNLFDSAALFLANSLALEPDSIGYKTLVGYYQDKMRSDSVLAISARALQYFPENRDLLLISARMHDKRYEYNEALENYLTLYELDTMDTLVTLELSYLQRKIAYLQRKRQEESALADSLATVPGDSTLN